MVEEKSNNNERVQVAITQPAFRLIELEREQIFKDSLLKHLFEHLKLLREFFIIETQAIKLNGKQGKSLQIMFFDKRIVPKFWLNEDGDGEGI